MDSDFTLVVIVILAFVMYAMGFRLVKGESPQDPEPTAQAPAESPPDVSPYTRERERKKVLLYALDSRPFTDVITPAQREDLRKALLGSPASVTPTAGASVEDAVETALPFVVPRPLVQGFVESTGDPVPASGVGQAVAASVVSDNELTEPVRPQREPLIESIRSTWDPAVMMLYLGALLVVVAGLIFASYNWGSLGGWQKLGMLAAGTIAFLLAGFVVRRVERLKPASTTFMTVGGLLVPANFLAAYTVFDDVQPSLPLLLGAIATTVVHALLSYQPNSNLFRYTTVGAAIVATATVPATLGLDAGWGGVVGLVLIAMLPEDMRPLERFKKPWRDVSGVAAIALAGFTLWQAGDITGWMLAATSVAASMVAARFSWRYPSAQLPLIVIADLFLIVASVQVAQNFDGDRWLISAGLLALTLVLLRESRRFASSARWLELAAAFSASLLVGDVTQVLAPDSWTIAAAAAALTILLVVHGRRHESVSLLTETIATVTTAIFAGELVRNVVDWEWGVAAFAAALVATLLLHARRWPTYASVSQGVAVFAAPVAFGTGVLAFNGSNWSVPIATGVLTFTLILYGIRHRNVGDIPHAVASLAGIATILQAADLLDLLDDPGQRLIVLLLLGGALTVLANRVLPRFTSTTGWLKSLVRIEALPLFFLATDVKGFDHAPTFTIIALALFWSLWVTGNAVWSLLLSGVIVLGWNSILAPSDLDTIGIVGWLIALSAILTVFGWQLDRCTSRSDEITFTAGIYAWVVMTLVAAATFTFTYLEWLEDGVGIEYGLAMLVQAALYYVAFSSTRQRPWLMLVGVFAAFANIILLFGDISTSQHAVIGVILFAIAAFAYSGTTGPRAWAGFVAGLIGLVHIQLATGFEYTSELLMALAAAWVLVSLGAFRWRSGADCASANIILRQAMLLHVVAWILPALTASDTQIARQDLVIVLISLAGVMATYGALRRSREIVLAGSAIGMAALVLQISIGSPGNMHAYTVPLSAYLIGVGLMLRRDPRIANVMLAAGSGMLVIPAIIEALTTGSINWLWVALAESVALFLFGTVLCLRIPSAAGVIAVSVIALRMLVFAVNALASWVSILATGVALLLVGTLWLIFRDAITARTQHVLSRWRSYD